MNITNEGFGQCDVNFQTWSTDLVIWNQQILMKVAHLACETKQAGEVQWNNVAYNTFCEPKDTLQAKRNNVAKFQRVWFGNAFAVPELPQMGHRSPS
jgi:hypothetical protein